MKMYFFVVISILLNCIQKTSTYSFPSTHIDWCLYFQRLHIYKPECKFYDDVDLHVEKEIRVALVLVQKVHLHIYKKYDDSQNNWFIPNFFTHLELEKLIFDSLRYESKPISNPSHQSLITIQMQQCSAHYMYCTANYQCGAGQLRCIDMIRYRECCAPTRRECPPVTHLNFRCIVSEPVSWCNEDSDCHTTPQQRCCPTGCNYNICI